MPDGGAGTGIIPRVTLEALLAHRERALTLAVEAHAAHLTTLAKIKEARAAAAAAANGTPEHSLYKLKDHVLSLDDNLERFQKTVRQEIDRAIWPSILRRTGLVGMMDKEARDNFDRDLASDPPECTEENIQATFQGLRADAYRIFRRGVVNVFRNLSREYRSHDGFKLGPRTVIQYGVSDYREYHTFGDADRIMTILDGGRVGEGWYSTLAERLRSEVKTEWRSRGTGWKASGRSVPIPGEITTEYWRVKWFQNANVHLWCRRLDLLRRANRLIAEHFEDALGAGPDAAGARKYHRAKPHHHEVEDFYRSTPDVASRAVTAANLHAPGVESVLEPSAGDGAIVERILAEGIKPDAVEIDPDRADILRGLLPPGAVIEMDFLAMRPEPEYQRIIMNPPWGRGAGIQHVLHALGFLAPGGRLVAILGPGLEYRSDGPTVELRKLVAAWGGRIERLPPGSFKASGTATDSVMLVLDKPAGAVPALPAPERQDVLL